MPVSKSLSKIKKTLAKKGKVTIHPKGRKFQKLTKATLREEKLAVRKRVHNERRSNELARVKFIQNVINMDSLKDTLTFTLDETVVFIQQFIDRDNEELNELIKRRRSDRPPSNKQQMLQNRRDLELEEFQKGFLCPDLSNVKNVEFLRKWNNSFGAMSTLQLVRINSEGKQVVGGNIKTNEPSQVDINMS